MKEEHIKIIKTVSKTMFLFLFALLVFGAHDNLTKQIKEAESTLQNNFQSIGDKYKYKDEVQRALTKGSSLSREGSSTIGYQGPNVEIHAIEFMSEDAIKQGEFKKSFTSVDQRYLNRNAEFSQYLLNFDPDHNGYGLPNLKVAVSPVHLGEANSDKADKSTSTFEMQPFGESFSEIKNYIGDIFKKNPILKTGPIKNMIWKGEGCDKNLSEEVSLFITRFRVAVTANPSAKEDFDLDIFSPEEKEKITFPRYWYTKLDANASGKLTLDELINHFSNENEYTYGHISVIFKINANSLAEDFFTINSDKFKSKGVDFAIGGLYVYDYTLDENSKEEPKLHPILDKGTARPLTYEYNELKYDRTLVSKNGNLNLDIEREGVVQEQISYTRTNCKTKKGRFWNTERYFDLRFDNIGARTTGLLGLSNRSDQITYDFVMPIYVRGNWEIKPFDQKHTGEFNPAKPLKGLTFFDKSGSVMSSIWGLVGDGIYNIGKWATLALLLIFLIAFLFSFFPSMIFLIERVFAIFFKIISSLIHLVTFGRQRN